ncbi:MAG: dipeptide epimerase [Niabella sp.]
MTLKCSYYPCQLRFRHPFTISKGTKTHQPTLVVSLEHLGITGYGEAPAITYYHISVEDMVRDLEAKLAMVERFAFTEPERYWHFLHHLFPNNNFLVCALDIAGWDIFGQLSGKPLYKLFGGEAGHEPVTDYTIGIDSVDKMVAKLKETPWPIYKIKVGTADDLAILRALRKETDAVFRVDANAGWDLGTARRIIPELKDLGVEFVEQPLAKDNWEGMEKLYKESPLPLFADESCVLASDVEKCQGYFHGINIKLTKCSGLTPALDMIKTARKLDLQVMVGSMCESTVGSAAIAHLLPLIDHVDMDGPLLLAEDVATGVGFDYGKVIYGEKPGLGIDYAGLYARKG